MVKKKKKKLATHKVLISQFLKHDGILLKSSHSFAAKNYLVAIRMNGTVYVQGFLMWHKHKQVVVILLDCTSWGNLAQVAKILATGMLTARSHVIK